MLSWAQQARDQKNKISDSLVCVRVCVFLFTLKRKGAKRIIQHKSKASTVSTAAVLLLLHGTWCAPTWVPPTTSLCSTPRGFPAVARHRSTWSGAAKSASTPQGERSGRRALRGRLRFPPVNIPVVARMISIRHVFAFFLCLCHFYACICTVLCC